MRTLIITGTIGLLAQSSLAARPGPPPEFFKKLDTNNDGRISFTEFQLTGPKPLHPRMKQVFNSLNPDAAGTLAFDQVTGNGHRQRALS